VSGEQMSRETKKMTTDEKKNGVSATDRVVSGKERRKTAQM
jgi:hypothetical protein